MRRLELKAGVAVGGGRWSRKLRRAISVPSRQSEPQQPLISMQRENDIGWKPQRSHHPLVPIGISRAIQPVRRQSVSHTHWPRALKHLRSEI
jgi:hypothetical protein